jgi:hypothetical protein
MVVDDLDIVCVAIRPAKADAPLVVDADTVLSAPLDRSSRFPGGAFKSFRDSALFNCVSLRLATFKTSFGIPLAKRRSHAAVAKSFPNDLIIKDTNERRY